MRCHRVPHAILLSGTPPRATSGAGDGPWDCHRCGYGPLIMAVPVRHGGGSDTGSAPRLLIIPLNWLSAHACLCPVREKNYPYLPPGETGTCCPRWG